MNKPNIVIIGYGRFGKLLVKMLRPYGRILVINRNRIKDKTIKQTRYKDLTLADWVIPAVPISALTEVLIKIKPHLKPGCLVMDVSSVKVMPCRWMLEHLPKEVDILGTHPMFGPDSAKYGLKGLSMVFCPIRIKPSRLKEIMEIFRRLRLDCVIMTPAAHDREAATSLALVHYIGRALGQLKIRPQQVSTLGFERLLSVNETVTNDTWQLFNDMHQYNPYAGKARQQYLQALAKINRRIKAIDKN